MSEPTPMMRQYMEIKSTNKDAILFFRLGDFYEMFGQDAEEASVILGITLTARNKKENPVPMCGVPYHAAEQYIAKLIKAGRKVAICEQTSDPTLPGLVKREIVRIVTPGTSLSDLVLENNSHRFLLAIFAQNDYFGLAFADLSTGECSAFELQGWDDLGAELLRLRASEILISREQYEHPDFRAKLAGLNEAPLSPIDFHEEAAGFLKRHFKVSTLESFGIANWPFAIHAAAMLTQYLRETQKSEVPHIDRIKAYHKENYMPVDEATMRNLDLLSPQAGESANATLLHVLDMTKSASGARLLSQWISRPLLRRAEIKGRHESLEDFFVNEDMRKDLRSCLAQIKDMERCLARLSSAQGNARDLRALFLSLEKMPLIKEILMPARASNLLALRDGLNLLDVLRATLENALLDDLPIRVTEGAFIADGYSVALDALRNLSKNAKSEMAKMEALERERTGISSLKIKYNRVYGYYLEISHSNISKVPENYIRKQTLVNAERYITPELKDYEEQVLHAEDRSKALEFELFIELRDAVLKEISAIKKNARICAELDVLASFAEAAREYDYVKPEISVDGKLFIENGRHPVIERLTQNSIFVPNDAEFISGEDELHLITGPNMSGKSTYLRQIALIALMNQIGSFVPASEAVLPIFDRIFTRVGASDKLSKGQSTFMVEMQESAYILHHASPNSLIILDELGRGTSTYDGLSLAWAIFEHLHDKVRAFALFATHYHELIDRAETLPRARNYSIDVRETEKGVVFLHKMKQGAINKSYGIEVAKLAGVPISVLGRATQILKGLEDEKLENTKSKVSENQMDIFQASQLHSAQLHPALEQLKRIDINTLTPLDALNALSELRKL